MLLATSIISAITCDFLMPVEDIRFELTKTVSIIG